MTLSNRILNWLVALGDDRAGYKHKFYPKDKAAGDPRRQDDKRSDGNDAAHRAASRPAWKWLAATRSAMSVRRK
jgi:hypothetical protein